MLFRQLFDHESATYSYLLADQKSKEAIIIDPVREQIRRDYQLIQELGLKLKYILETHVHADHISGAALLREATQAKIAISKAANVDSANIHLADADELEFGDYRIRTIYTPGHTQSCNSYLLAPLPSAEPNSLSANKMLFSGDTLFIRGCGRTDFQEGNPSTLYQSIKEKLYILPDTTLVYPAHNYTGQTVTSIGEEKQFNPRINQNTSENEFIETMNSLQLAKPEKIKLAVPANLNCGLSKIMTVEEAHEKLNDPDYYFIDTRSPEEHQIARIPNTSLIVHSEILENLDRIPKDKQIVLYCRSGRRSGIAQMELEKLNYSNIYNMQGGILAWQDACYLVEP